MKHTGPPAFIASGGPTVSPGLTRFLHANRYPSRYPNAGTLPLEKRSWLFPADSIEKSRDLFARAIGILAVRKVSDARKHREIEIAERLAQSIGPGIGKQRIVLGPAHAGRHLDRRDRRCLTLQHPDPPGMGGAVIGKAAVEVAFLQKIVGKGVEHIVESIFAMRPVLQKIADIGAAAFAGRADNFWRDVQLVERLVPDVVQPLRFRHPRADAGI